MYIYRSLDNLCRRRLMYIFARQMLLKNSVSDNIIMDTFQKVSSLLFKPKSGTINKIFTTGI